MQPQQKYLLYATTTRTHLYTRNSHLSFAIFPHSPFSLLLRILIRSICLHFNFYSIRLLAYTLLGIAFHFQLHFVARRWESPTYSMTRLFPWQQLLHLCAYSPKHRAALLITKFLLFYYICLQQIKVDVAALKRVRNRTTTHSNSSSS